MAHYCAHPRAPSAWMKQLGSTMAGPQVGLGPRRREMESLEAPTIVMTQLAMEWQMPYFRYAIRGAAIHHLDHLMRATKS